jgi:ribonucleoside-diphosphate reductase alpha chain
MRRGGGVGYDFSRIRPRGAWVAARSSSASGPVSYMRVFDRSCETVESAGAGAARRWACCAATTPTSRSSSTPRTRRPEELQHLVGVTDAFMQAVLADGEVELVHRAEPGAAQKAAGAYQRARRPDAGGLWVYRKLRARDLWDQIMRSTYDHAEPGVLFLDTINRDNNLSYCETIAATNPCAEQPLPPYGCCCLGSIDLTRFVRDPFEAEARFDEAGFAAAGARWRCACWTTCSTSRVWPLPQQQAEARKRRVGLGFTGLGDALVMLGLRYDTEPARAHGLAHLRADARRAYARRRPGRASAAPSRCSTPTCT